MLKCVSQNARNMMCVYADIQSYISKVHKHINIYSINTVHTCGHPCRYVSQAEKKSREGLFSRIRTVVVSGCYVILWVIFMGISEFSNLSAMKRYYSYSEKKKVTLVRERLTYINAIPYFFVPIRLAKDPHSWFSSFQGWYVFRHSKPKSRQWGQQWARDWRQVFIQGHELPNRPSSWWLFSQVGGGVTRLLNLHFSRGSGGRGIHSLAELPCVITSPILSLSVSV